MRTPDYALVLDYGAYQEQYHLWFGDSDSLLMNSRSSTALYKFTDGYDQKLRSLIAQFEPISVYEGNSKIAVNQVTEKEKQATIKGFLSAATWESMTTEDYMIDQSYRFVVEGSPYLLHIADDVYTVTNHSNKHFHMKKDDRGANLAEALGVHLLVDYGIPLGSKQVQRYCGYIYYTVNGRLYRMRENGTGFEQLITKADNTGRLIEQGGSLYFFSGNPDKTVYQIQTDSRVAPLLPMVNQVGEVLTISEKYIYYSTFPQLGKLTAMRRRSIHGKTDNLIKQGTVNQAVLSDEANLLYYTVASDNQPTDGTFSGKLVKSLQDGRYETRIDEGSIDQLTLCGDFLVYRKSSSGNQSQIWAFDTIRSTLRLLADSETVGMDAVSVNIIDADDSEEMLYYSVSSKTAGSALYRIKPRNVKHPDQLGSLEIVWNGIKSGKTLLQVDLSGGWLYDAVLSEILPASGSTTSDSGKTDWILPSHRCRLDGSSDIAFSASTAIEPFTISKWIYFISYQEATKEHLLQRYNTETEQTENLQNGVIRN